MRTKFSPFRFALGALCALSLLGLPAHSQEKEKDKGKQHHDGIVQDWSRHHALYPRFGAMNRLIALQHDPRAIEAWQASFRKDWRREEHWRGERFRHRDRNRNRTVTHRDWSISLGAGGMAPAMYPAKWTFDSNESLSGASADTGACATDYIVFTVDTAAGVGQPNIVGLNNLYSGTAGLSGNGVCNRTPSGPDDGVSATTLFSYAVIGDDGVVATSPTTSMDGTKIAFVEGTTTAAHFHVLAWNAGDGNNDGLNRQDPVTNAFNITSFTPNAPTAGTATDFALGAITTLSSPFVEYSADVAYVGDDAGVLYKFKDVFCTTAACTSAVPNPAPSLDTTWGGTGSVTVCAGALTGAIADGASGNIFVGCSDGNLYGFTPDGTPITGSPLTVGDGNPTNGGLVDPPVLDEVNGFIYVETGSSFVTGAPILMQANINSFAINSTADLSPLGTSTLFNLHAPVFNDAYFTDGNSAHWFLYEYSSDTTPEIALYGITFDSSHAMTPGVPANVVPFGIGPYEISPLTEFLTTGGEDRVFASALVSIAGNLLSFRVNDLAGNPPDGFPSTFESFASEGFGTTGMVIDNASGAGQANSIYFGELGGGTPNAVKLTQVDLM